jgi:hypothetical protein
MPTLYLRTGMLGGTTLDNNTKKRISPLSQSLFIERYVMKPVLIYSSDINLYGSWDGPLSETAR